MRARLLSSLLLMFALALPALAQDRRGGASLDRVLPHVRQSVPGTFYDAEGPFFGPNGRPTYRLKWMTPDNRIIWFSVDAQSGQVIGGVPAGPPPGRYRDAERPAPWGGPPRNEWQDNGGGWGDRDGQGWGGWSGRGGREGGCDSQGGWGSGDNSRGGRGGWGNGDNGRGGQGSWGHGDNSRGGPGGWGGRSGQGERDGQGGRGGWGNRGGQGGDGGKGGRGGQGGGRGSDDRGGGGRHRPHGG